MILALLCAVAQGAWAQTTVTTDSELRTAIQIDGVKIQLANDIDLSNSTLSIPEGTTVTIDLGGHTLDRKLTQRGEGGGINNEGGTANLTDVNITGCVSDDRGGGIYIFSTATLNMKGKMTITDNIGKEGLKHNVFLKENAVITVTGALTDSKIGITLEDETGTFTSGYKDNNSDVDPATIFTSDLTGVMAVSPDDNNEAQLSNSLPDGDVYCRYWQR